MNWDAVGAIADLLSAIGVLATLLYLAHQIKLNTKEVRDSALQAIQEQNIALFDSDLQTDIVNILDRILLGETVTASEKRKVRVWFVRGMKFSEHVFLQHQRGRVDDQVFQTYRTRLATYMSQPWAQEYWPTFKYLFTPDFVDHVARVGAAREET